MSDQPKISKLKLIPDDHVFTAKRPCPYCGGEISCSANAWEESDDGYIATDLDIQCSNEPDLDSEEWNEWDRLHGRCDYNEAWHQLHDRLVNAINRAFRFDMQNVGGAAARSEATDEAIT